MLVKALDARYPNNKKEKTVTKSLVSIFLVLIFFSMQTNGDITKYLTLQNVN